MIIDKIKWKLTDFFLLLPLFYLFLWNHSYNEQVLLITAFSSILFLFSFSKLLENSKYKNFFLGSTILYIFAGTIISFKICSDTILRIFGFIGLFSFLILFISSISIIMAFFINQNNKTKTVTKDRLIDLLPGDQTQREQTADIIILVIEDIVKKVSGSKLLKFIAPFISFITGLFTEYIAGIFFK
ncbi:MAG: hypothetical protein GF353_18365 [Candidatus Lokiarchaeota archaeon]|nr:hypothetical protein [Candidatus Lokiarchaeota archaeon]